MKDDVVSYMTRYPRAISNILAMSVLAGVFIHNLVEDRGSDFYYLNVVGMVIPILYILMLLKKMISPLILTIGPDYIISTRNEIYEPIHVECIYLSYRRIGIKLYGKRLVPSDLCFHFTEGQEKEGHQKLKEWAEKNNIKIKHKFFSEFNLGKLQLDNYFHLIG